MTSDRKVVCFSGNTRGHIARALREAMESSQEYSFVADDNPQYFAPDIAICSYGALRIQSPETVTAAQLLCAHESNYAKPVAFIEKMIAVMQRDGKHGLILVLGSNAAWGGNPGADHYAAYKGALRQFCALRNRRTRDAGIRLCYLGLGAVATDFWWKAIKDADPALVPTIAPDMLKALRLQDVASLVHALCQLPEQMSVKELLVVSREYQ